MDPHIVFDCQKVLPNPFALTLAAAARSRALTRGAEPRLNAADHGVNELALHEIAAGAFTQDELAPFLPGAGQRRFLPPPNPAYGLRGGSSGSAAAVPASRPREPVH